MRSQCACQGTPVPGRSAARPARWSACPHRKLPWSFHAAVLPCLFVLLLFRLCQYCGIGVFRFQQQLVTRGLFCLVGISVDLAHKIVFVNVVRLPSCSVSICFSYSARSGTEASTRSVPSGASGAVASICFFSVRNTACSSSAAFRRILWQRLSTSASEWRQ